MPRITELAKELAQETQPTAERWHTLGRYHEAQRKLPEAMGWRQLAARIALRVAENDWMSPLVVPPIPDSLPPGALPPPPPVRPPPPPLVPPPPPLVEGQTQPALWHSCPGRHAAQAMPSVPQCKESVARHSPLAEQHPKHEPGPHAGVGGQPLKRSARKDAARGRERRRMGA